MRIVIQRVKNARVEVAKKVISKVGEGTLIFLGVEKSDSENEVKYLADKILNLRIFADKDDKMNKSVLDIRGEILVVSQFTLCADCQKGRRPSFIEAAEPKKAEELYLLFIKELKKSGLKVETGKFRAMMDIHLINDGPVTIILDTKNP